MKNIVRAAGLAGILAMGFGAATPKAAELTNTAHEGQGVTTALGANASAITYWVNETDGWHVVTTVDTVIGQDSSTERHAIVRFSSVLLPGQSALISVPSAIGERQQVLRIRRVGDQVEIGLAFGSA
jgi:hypothetical protein